MTTKERAKLFDEPAGEDLDISAFKPKPLGRMPSPSQKEVKAISEAVNFPSRQAPRPTTMKQAKREPRIHRTGRNVQFQAKATQATIDRFYKICEQEDFRLGEALERAVDALERELKARP